MNEQTSSPASFLLLTVGRLTELPCFSGFLFWHPSHSFYILEMVFTISVESAFWTYGIVSFPGWIWIFVWHDCPCSGFTGERDCLISSSTGECEKINMGVKLLPDCRPSLFFAEEE